MNDMEADARRLMATATSDMPDGIDLLDGFSRARAHSRRRRGRAVVSAGVAVTAAAVTAIALAVSPAPSALAAVRTALNNTLHAQSYRYTDDSGIYYVINGKIQSRSDLACTGEQDPVRNTAESYCPGQGRSMEVGGYYYYTFHMRSVSGRGDKYWWGIKLSELRQFPQPALPNLANDTPQKILSVIETGAKVTAAGPASGSGWTGTRYTFTWTGKPGKDGTLTLSPETVSGTVDVDQQGRTRVLVYNDRSTAGDGTVLVQTYDMTYSAFGVKVTITPPPASQTYILTPPSKP
jgi:hypothetical protein